MSVCVFACLCMHNVVARHNDSKFWKLGNSSLLSRRISTWFSSLGNLINLLAKLLWGFYHSDIVFKILTGNYSGVCTTVFLKTPFSVYFQFIFVMHIFEASTWSHFCNISLLRTSDMQVFPCKLRARIMWQWPNL